SPTDPNPRPGEGDAMRVDRRMLREAILAAAIAPIGVVGQSGGQDRGPIPPPVLPPSYHGVPLPPLPTDPGGPSSFPGAPAPPMVGPAGPVHVQGHGHGPIGRAVHHVGF